MPVRMQRRMTAASPIEADQVCARGWKDYMIETRLLLDETRVGDYLRGCTTTQLKRLGLTTGDIAVVNRR